MLSLETSPLRRLHSVRTVLPPGVTPPGTRGTILAAALGLFAERGFAGTSIRDIAAQTGVKSASLYAHYPSKEHLLAELVRIGHEEHFRLARESLLEGGTDPRAQLRVLVRAHIRMHASYPMLAVVANAELHMLTPELGSAAFALRHQSEELIHDVVRRGVERGVFHVPHAWLATAAIGGMGIRVAHWYSTDFELAIEEIEEVYATFALRLVGAVEGGES